jgi:hypothetical protein
VNHVLALRGKRIGNVVDGYVGGDIADGDVLNERVMGGDVVHKACYGQGMFWTDVLEGDVVDGNLTGGAALQRCIKEVGLKAGLSR